MRNLLRAGVAVTLVGLSTFSTTAASEPDSPSSLATYHDRTIDMSVSWEGAQACHVSDDGNFCYDSEEEMDAAHPELLTERAMSTLASCSTSLRLYDVTSFGAPSLSLSQRGSWIALSTYGFSAITSSYIVGACNSAFRDAALTIYPGSTVAGASATSMLAGWNNRVTAVFIA